MESPAPGYLRGQSASEDEKHAVVAAGGQVHAYTDSAPSAGEYATGIKMFNNGINVADDGRLVPTLFNQLQAEGWKVGTVTSVPFNHASPAAMYAHNVSRDDYQDLGREMLGLDSIVQTSGKGPRLPGLDVVIGCGWGAKARDSDLLKQGSNAIAGNPFITDEDLQAINVENGGRLRRRHSTGWREGSAGSPASRRPCREGQPPLVRLLRSSCLRPPAL